MLGPPATAMGEVFEYLVERAPSSTSGADSTHERPRTDSLSLMDLTTVQEYTIKPLLRTVPGVANVNTWGGMQQQFQVLADPAKLAGYGLTLEDVETALAKNNANFGAGYVEERGERLTVRGVGRVTDTADVANVVIATQVARRSMLVTSAEWLSHPHFATEPCRAMAAVKRSRPPSSCSRVQMDVRSWTCAPRIDEIRPLLPKGVRIVPFYNQGDVVQRTTHTVFKNLVEGALLVTAILFLFLRNVRASLLTASVIPLSLLFAFLAMRRFGITANLMSLGALDFGLIVDGSVVMVENFVRRLGEQRDSRGSVDRHELLRHAAFEVGRPIVFGIAIIVAVYIPIFTLTGLEGRMFRPMAFTVCAAVLGSLLLALTYVPAIFSYLFTGGQTESLAEAHEAPAWFARLRTRYDRTLEWAVLHRASRHRNRCAPARDCAWLGSVPGHRVHAQARRRLPATRDASTSERIAAPGLSVSAEVERTLRRFPEVASVVTNLGRPQEATERWRSTRRTLRDLRSADRSGASGRWMP